MVSTRIYPVIAPQDVTDPYVTYQRVSGERVIDFGGASNLEQPHYQVSGYADDYLESQNMAEPIIVAMMAATGFSVTSISFLPDEEENAMYSVSLDFGISHDLT
jgi:hypothetical protein